MKPLRRRLEEVRKNTGLSWETIERDYVLSWVLAGTGVNEKLQKTLIFKGGTALNTGFRRTSILPLGTVHQVKMNLRKR